MPYKNWKTQKAAQHKSYLKHKVVLAAKQARKRAELRAKYNAYKNTLSCEFCKESDSICLEFHHIDPDTKIKPVSVFLQSTTNWQKVLDEIAKCQCLCANCHRKLHRDIRLGLI